MTNQIGVALGRVALLVDEGERRRFAGGIDNGERDPAQSPSPFRSDHATA